MTQLKCKQIFSSCVTFIRWLCQSTTVTCLLVIRRKSAAPSSMANHNDMKRHGSLLSVRHSPESQRKHYRATAWSLLSPSSIADRPHFPLNRAKHASCQYGDHVFVYGGKDGRLNRKDLWKYHTAEERWEKVQTQGTAPPSPQEITMVAYKAKLYVFGGEFQFAGEADCPLWILHLDSYTWERFHINSDVVTPVNRRGHATVICNSAIHIHGGFVDLRGSSSELWTLDLESMSWHLAHIGGTNEDGPGGRHDHSAIMYDGAMYIYGGMSGLQPKDDLWKWTFSGRFWSRVKCGKGPPPLKGHSACRVGDIMLLYGGLHNGVQHGHLWAFSFNSSTWTKLNLSGPSPAPRGHHTAVLLMGPTPKSSTTDRTHSVPLLHQVSRLVPATRPASSPANMNRKQDSTDSKILFQNKINPIQSGITPPDAIEMTDLNLTQGNHSNDLVSRKESSDWDSSMTSDEKENMKSQTPCPDGSHILGEAHSKTGMYKARQGVTLRQVSRYRRQRISLDSMSSTNDELPLLRRTAFDDSSSLLSSGVGLDNPMYHSQGKLSTDAKSVRHNSGDLKINGNLQTKSYSLNSILNQRTRSHEDISSNPSELDAGGKRICHRQFSDDFVPHGPRFAPQYCKSLGSQAGMYGVFSSISQDCVLSQVTSVTDPKSCSLNSLLHESQNVENFRDYGACYFEPRSISKDDLILEDIEDLPDDLLDDSQSELLLHDAMETHREPGAVNQNMTLKDESNHQSLGDNRNKSFDNQLSFLSQLDSVEMAVSFSPAQEVRVDNNWTRSEKRHQRKEVWGSPPNNNPTLAQPSSGSSVTMEAGSAAECIEMKPLVTAPVKTRQIVESDGCLRTQQGKYHRPASTQVQKHAVPVSHYVMLILGGAESESISFITKPLSVWKLDVEVMMTH